jgi:hypothetical protein
MQFLGTKWFIWKSSKLQSFFWCLNSSSTDCSIWTHVPSHATTRTQTHTHPSAQVKLTPTQRGCTWLRDPKSSRLRTWRAHHSDHCGASMCEATDTRTCKFIIGENPNEACECRSWGSNSRLAPGTRGKRANRATLTAPFEYYNLSLESFSIQCHLTFLKNRFQIVNTLNINLEP